MPKQAVKKQSDGKKKEEEEEEEEEGKKRNVWGETALTYFLNIVHFVNFE